MGKGKKLAVLRQEGRPQQNATCLMAVSQNPGSTTASTSRISVALAAPMGAVSMLWLFASLSIASIVDVAADTKPPFIRGASVTATPPLLIENNALKSAQVRAASISFLARTDDDGLRSAGDHLSL